TYKWIDDLFRQGGTSQAAVNYTYFSISDALVANTVAMAVMGSQRVAALRSAGAKDDLGYAGVPGWEASKPGPGNAVSQTLVIGRDSTKKEAAMKFIDFMTGPKAAVELAKGGEIPPRKS